MKEIWGLIGKDWALMAKQMRMLVVYLIVIFALFSFTTDGMLFLVSFFSVLVFMMSTNCFAYDEQAGFGKLLAASPVSIRKAVLARYLLTFLVGTGGSVIVTLANLLLSSFRQKGGDSMEESLIAMFTSIGIALLLMSILFPLFYKFGVNKSRLMILLVCAVPVGAVALLQLLLPETVLSNVHFPAAVLAMFPFAAALILVCLVAVSIHISTRVLQKLEY